MTDDTYSILAVDDEPIVHSMVETIIRESDLPARLVGVATSGKDALMIAPKLRPDICLLDINMEDMDGLELARRLSDVLDYKPRIIYLTAYDRFDYARDAIKVGAIEYILKPIQRQELIAAIGKGVNALQADRLARLERELLEEHAGVASSVETPVQSRLSTLVIEIRKYIDEHYAENISLSDVADHVRLSSGYIGSIFKSQCGFSFRAFLRAVRVSKAKELMHDPRLNLSEIAQLVGYEDVNYFSQAFLVETGVRPSEYRGSGRRWAK